MGRKERLPFCYWSDHKLLQWLQSPRLEITAVMGDHSDVIPGSGQGSHLKPVDYWQTMLSTQLYYFLKYSILDTGDSKFLQNFGEENTWKLQLGD
jgi:hypothetical protein